MCDMKLSDALRQTVIMDFEKRFQFASAAAGLEEANERLLIESISTQSELSALRERLEWRPIETVIAGRPVLLLFPDGCVGENECDPEAGWKWGGVDDATHWMPKPADPAPPSEGGEG